MRRLAALSFALALAAPALAQEAAIRKNLAERLPNFPKIDEVVKSPIPGLYEVRSGNEIFYTDEQGNYYFNSVPILDTKQIYDRQLPQDLISINYNGVITNSFFVEGQFSRRTFTFENSGSRFTDLIKGTPIRDISRGGVSTKASSVPAARMLLSCFCLHTFTSRSSSRLFCPTTMPW